MFDPICNSGQLFFFAADEDLELRQNVKIKNIYPKLASGVSGNAKTNCI